jgi:glycosyltransferase involved in cell wall biosynthesis
MRKKILIVTDNLRDQINGVVTTFSNIETLADRDGYDIVYLDPGQFSHFACPGYPEVRLCWPYGISAKIKTLQPDYIHIATEGPVGLFARWWCEKNAIPYNTSYHTDFAKFLKKIYKIPESWTYWYLRWFHKNSHRILVTTKTIQDTLALYGFKRMVIWTRGVARTETDFRTSTVAGRPILLSVGRVSQEKNLDKFCELDYPIATKIIVGDGPYRKSLQARYPDIIFTGYKTGESLAHYYANADVFVFPSCADTFGLVIIEAMAQGTPIAAYPVQGPIDIIENGVNGYMDEDLDTAVEKCLTLDRNIVKQSSQIWTWEKCWTIFRDNLIDCANN